MSHGGHALAVNGGKFAFISGIAGDHGLIPQRLLTCEGGFALAVLLAWLATTSQGEKSTCRGIALCLLVRTGLPDGNRVPAPYDQENAQ
jgi:hypothetical protein